MDVVLGEPAQGCDEVHQVTEGEYIFMNSMAEFKLWKRDLWRAPTPGSVLVEFQGKELQPNLCRNLRECCCSESG